MKIKKQQLILILLFCLFSTFNANGQMLKCFFHTNIGVSKSRVEDRFEGTLGGNYKSKPGFFWSYGGVLQLRTIKNVYLLTGLSYSKLNDSDFDKAHFLVEGPSMPFYEEAKHWNRVSVSYFEVPIIIKLGSDNGGIYFGIQKNYLAKAAKITTKQFSDQQLNLMGQAFTYSNDSEKGFREKIPMPKSEYGLIMGINGNVYQAMSIGAKVYIGFQENAYFLSLKERPGLRTNRYYTLEFSFFL